MKVFTYLPLILCLAIVVSSCNPPQIEQIPTPPDNLDIIAYYSGPEADIDKYPIEKLDQIIYSFLHLDGNQLAIDNAADSSTLLALTGLKIKYPELKIMVALGGWGGCEPCSPIFATEENRISFAQSTLQLLEAYDADGIDLDWEYPAITGHPGHPFLPEDKQNFTALIKELRNTLGDQYEISFAAGGFETFLNESVEWSKVMPLINRVNLMSYDLINGYSTETGHHSSLFSNANQKESTDYAVQYLDSLGVPLNKIVIGCAFYSRIWGDVENINHGLYQSGNFVGAAGYDLMDSVLSNKRGFQTYWDATTKATYSYSDSLKLFATYDDPQSIAAKVAYAREKGLGGLMFWELRNDKYQGGLLDVMYKAVNN